MGDQPTRDESKLVGRNDIVNALFESITEHLGYKLVNDTVQSDRFEIHQSFGLLNLRYEGNPSLVERLYTLTIVDQNMQPNPTDIVLHSVPVELIQKTMPSIHAH
ncbi:unnamed protein product [Citrullus colocynthis]|uniref:Uncharacterized protein n=1 Tax=Citrullus colocynthis TaxID=252529 RepID=A0ABP0XQ97_9ROSI